MTAYIDMIILENLIMNVIILNTTAKLLNRSVKKRRIIISSLIGTLYVFTLCFNCNNLLLNISKIVMGITLVKICFGSAHVNQILKETIVFFFTSFVYAGCALAFMHIAKPKVVYIVNGIIIGGEYIFEIAVLSAVVGMLLIKSSIKLIKLKSHFNRRNMICNIEIFHKNRRIKLKALLDTGNLLIDPISNQPVVIVYKESIRSLFSNEFLNEIDQMMGGDAEFKSVSCENIRAVPFSSVGNKDGVLIACVVDKMKVEYQDELNEINNVLIGFYNEALSKNSKYSALIGLQILEGSKINNEYIANAKGKGKYSIC